MILDRLLQFTGGTVAPGNSDGKTDVPTTGAQTSSFIVDIGVGLQTTTNPLGAALPPPASGAGARDLGIGDDPALKVLVEVVVAFAGGTSLQIVLQGAPDNGSGAPGAFTTYASGPVVAVANLIQGAHICDLDVPRPAPGVALPRYWQLAYTIVGTFTGGGAIEGFFVLDRWDQIVSTTGAASGYVPGITIPN